MSEVKEEEEKAVATRDISGIIDTTFRGLEKDIVDSYVPHEGNLFQVVSSFTFTFRQEKTLLRCNVLGLIVYIENKINKE